MELALGHLNARKRAAGFFLAWKSISARLVAATALGIILLGRYGKGLSKTGRTGINAKP